MKGLAKKSIKKLIIAGIILLGILGIAIGITLKKSVTKDSIPAEELARLMTYEQLNDENEYVENCENIKFGAFFTKDLNGDGRAEKILGTCKPQNSTDIMYIDLAVEGEGVFKDGMITLNTDGNFKYKVQMTKDLVLKNNLVGEVTEIELNDMTAGTQEMIMGSIISVIPNRDYFSKVNFLTLTGTYVDEEGAETEINQTVNVTVDWYGNAYSKMTSNAQEYSFNSTVLPENATTENTTFTFGFKMQEVGLPNEKNVIDIDIPSLYDYYPTSVVCSANSTYDEENHKLVIEDETSITNKSYSITLTYPLEIYEQLRQEIMSKDQKILSTRATGYSLCENNPNEEFENPYRTSTVFADLTVKIKKEQVGGYPASHLVGTYLNNKTWVGNPYGMYCIRRNFFLEEYDKESPKSITYDVEYKIMRERVDTLPTTLVIEDTVGDCFSSMNLSNYVKCTGIKITNSNLLPADASINIYDTSSGEDVLVMELLPGEWSLYTPYKFDKGISHLKIETSEDLQSRGCYFDVVVTKEFDMKAFKDDYPRTTLEDVSNYSTSARFSGNNMASFSDSDYARIPDEKSRFEVNVEPKTISTEEINPISQKIQIDTKYLIPDAKWKDAVYLVRIPESNIASFKIKDIPNVDGYELYKKNGYYNVKIIKNSDEPNYDSITINAEILADPMSTTNVKKIDVYAYNSNCENYYNRVYDTYDLDGDGSTVDYVGYNSTTFEITAPSTFVTSETITDYDDEESITIAPNIAEISKATRSAKINVLFLNNYGLSVSNVKILGKIPFAGNTYDNGNDLKSTFDTHMTSEGITVPSSLSGAATVYYSENGNTNKNLEDESNGWKTADEIDDFNKVKTYLIVLNSETITRGKAYKFSYDITVPEGIKLNEASYSCHTVYFDLNTTGGLLANSLPTRKTGLRIAEYYDLDVIKYKEYTSHPIKGAIYQITSEENDEIVTRLATSNAEGHIQVSDLRINQEYTMKEIKSPNNYELSSNDIKFKINEKDDGTFEYVCLSENDFASEVVIGEKNNGKTILTSTVTDVPKAIVRINVKEQETQNPITGLVFVLDGNLYVTNGNGIAEFKNISLSKEYELRETYLNGYYSIGDVTFNIVKNGSEFSVESNRQEFRDATITNPTDSDLVIVEVNFETTTIPTYNLQIEKVSEINSEEKLANAKFSLQKVDLNTSYIYTTDENGIINITDLYEYVEGKDVTGEYILKEIQAPNGYLVNDEEIKFVVSKNDIGELEINIDNRANLESVRKTEVVGENVTIVINNRPLFKLTKTDSETDEPLSNVEFVIYELDANGNEVGFAKDVDGNYIGTPNESGDYIVKTNSRGVIQASLNNGDYKVVEYRAPEGYADEQVEEFFTVSSNVEEVETEDNFPAEYSTEKEILNIEYIEDLVTLSNNVKNGNVYANTFIKLTRDLDFQDPESYRNSEDTSFGDINGNGTVETIIEELTNEDGTGFPAIGTSSYGLQADFDGQNHEIKNLYMNVSDGSYVGFFGKKVYSSLNNFGISGNITANGSTYNAGLVGYGQQLKIYNCHSEINLNITNSTSNYIYVAGILSENYSSSINKCYNAGNINVTGTRAQVRSIGETVNNCYNTGNINVNVTDFAKVGGISLYSLTKNSYTTGNIEVVSTSGGKGIIDAQHGENNCYYLEDIVVSGDGFESNGTQSGIPKSAEYMKSQEFISDLGSENWKLDEENVNNGFPIFNFEDNNSYITEINYIEDLVELSKQVNSGIDYSNRTITLNRTLDFKDSNSYKNSEDTSYGDLNYDEQVESIMVELTKEEAQGFNPIGGWNCAFKGTFDGNNKEIKNLYINSKAPRHEFSSYIGLFGSVFNGNIKNVTVTGDIIAEYEVGGICGVFDGYGRIENCVNRCNVGYEGSSNYIGGIVGVTNYSRISSGYQVIKNCSNYGRIIGNSEIGGIIGQNGDWTSNVTTTSYIYNCNNYGEIVCNDMYAGGMIGKCDRASSVVMRKCNNYGILTGNGTIFGGIIGDVYNTTNSYYIKECTNNGNIYSQKNSSSYGFGGIIGDISASGLLMEDCYNTGNIILEKPYGSYVGGIVGRNNSTSMKITNSWNSGNFEVYGGNYVGGIVGNTSGSLYIEKCYNTGTLHQKVNPDTSSYSYYYTGGIVGYAGSGYIGNCYNTGTLKFDAPSYYVYCGGICGYSYSSSSSYSSFSVIYSYNKGDIIVNNAKKDVYVGGISGYCYSYYYSGSSSYNSSSFYKDYNIGNINVTINGNESGYTYIGGINGIGASSIAYCYNKGNISLSNNSNYFTHYIGGLLGNSSNSGSKTISCSYNTGNIFSYGSASATSSSSGMYIGGLIGNISDVNGITGCYNSGNIENILNTGYYSYIYLGGICGGNSTSGGLTNNCYNTGNIKNTVNSNNYSNVYIGGIEGWVSSMTTKNSYNTGDIYNFANTNCTDSKTTSYVGGIRGSGNGTIVYTYDTGYIYNYVNNLQKEPIIFTGAIYGNGSVSGAYNYYPSNLGIVGENIQTNITTEVTDEYLKSEDLYNILSAGSTLWKHKENNYSKLKLLLYGSGDSDISVTNTKLRFDITTEVEENDEGYCVGGSLSGSYNDKYLSLYTKKFVETVKYGEDSKEDIVITPAEGYQITKITINGELLPFEADENGNYTIPAGYFKNVTTNYNVKATFAKLTEILTINKVDENNNKIEGATFKIEEVETRKNIDTEIKSLVNDSQIYKVEDVDAQANDLLGPVTKSGTYGFIQQANGTYVANNYGVKNSVADSYVKIDLTDKTDAYYVLVNLAQTDYAGTTYAKITDNTTALTSSTVSGSFSNWRYNQSYTAKELLQPGSVYYLHIAYIRGTSTANTDRSTINSINLYKAKSIRSYWTEDNGTYTLQNANNNPVGVSATSYIPLDLRNLRGNYNFTMSVNKVGNGYGGIVINESPNMVTYSSDLVVNLTSGTIMGNYTKKLKAGKMYYIHFYEWLTNNSTNNSCVISNLTGTPCVEDLYQEEGIKTNADGQIFRGLHYGKYNITETEAAEGYILNSEILTHDIGDGTNNEITIVNQTKRKVTAHYYLKNTGEEYNNEPVRIAEDKILYGIIDENYSTTPEIQIGEYVLLKENNEYVIPENASGKFTEDSIDVYYYYEKEQASYTIHYLYNEEEDLDKKETETVDVGTVVNEYEDKVIEGYKLDSVENLPLTVKANAGTRSGSNDIYVKYVKDVYAYTVHYFYDGIENVDNKETDAATFGSTIDTYIDKNDGFAFEKAKAFNDNKEEVDLPLTIKTDSTKNVINVYYRTPYDITTEVIEHDELYSDGNTEKVKGGTISGELDEKYETVLKGKDSTKDIQIKPEEGYKIVNIKIKDGIDAENAVTVDFSNMIDENGIVTLNSENGYFKNMQSDKHIEVEFRKNTSVIVKYLEKDTNEILAPEETIEGYEGQEKTTNKKVVTNYMSSDPEITDENGTEKTSTVILTGDVQTRIYWYERIPSGIIVRHIAVNEDDIEEGLTLNSGTEIESERLNGFVSLTEEANRKVYSKENDVEINPNFKNCISVNGPTSTNVDIIVAGKDDNTITATYKEDVVVEVRFYYERQYNIILETKEHTENKTGTELQVKGGHIEGEDIVPYEVILEMGSNEKSIVVVPDYGYKVKTITVNDEAIDLTGFTEGENHVITIPKEYFTDVQEEKYVQAEFERISARVITVVEDVDTGDEISREIGKEGDVGDHYEITPKTIDNYRLVETPTNATGEMTEDDIVVVFKYKRVFKIKTKIVLHDEVLRPKIILPKDSDQAITSIQVKGGTISGEDDDIYESVDRGENSTKDIELKADENYKIVSLTKNGNDMDITNEAGFMLDKFNNIQEDIEIAVKYEKLKFWLTVKYLDKATNEAISTEDKVEGYINEQYETKPKAIDGYEYVATEGNAEGTLVEDTIVKHYYNKKAVPPPTPDPTPDVPVKDAIVIIEYTDVDTGEILEDDVVYEGKVGDTYDVRDKVKEIPGYKPTQAPTELQGTIDNERVVIVYYYKKIQNMPVIEEKGGEPEVPEAPQVIEESFEPVVEKTPDVVITQTPEQVVNQGMKTGDNIIWTFITLVSSSLVLVITVIKKIRQ